MFEEMREFRMCLKKVPILIDAKESVCMGLRVSCGHKDDTSI